MVKFHKKDIIFRENALRIQETRKFRQIDGILRALTFIPREKKCIFNAPNIP